MRNTRAFTLMELMIVVALIGLLSTLAGRHIYTRFTDAQSQIALAKCREYHDGTWSWMMMTKAPRPPESLKDLDEPIRPGDRNYMPYERDPWGTHYRIEREGGRLFRIWSNGPDAEPDTDDDICYEPLDEADR